MYRWINSFLASLLFFQFCAPISVWSQITPEDQHFIYSSYSKKISMDLKDASLTDIFKIFSKQSGKNFVAAQEIASKRVSLYLDNVPFDEALDQILLANDLEYVANEGGGVFVVHAKKPPNDPVITRVYFLKYASVSLSKINNTINVDEVASSSSSSSSTSSSESGSVSQTAATGGTSGGGASGSGAISGISDVIKAVLSRNGKLVEDTRTNSLIISDVTSQFLTIEATLAKLDVPVPQILIEVEMLDISKATSELMGVKWGETIFKFAGASKNSLLPFNQTAILEKPGTTLSTEEGKLPYYIPTNTTIADAKGGNLDFAGMTAAVQFLKTQNDTKLLAKPRILTLNNQTAVINISTDEVIGTTANTISGTSTSTTEEADRVQTGIFLKVTPQADVVSRNIVLAIHPKVSDKGVQVTFNGKQFMNPEERATQAILKVRDGETIMIGGLVRSDDQNIITKVPVLGSIPFVGGLFRHKDKRTTTRELVVFMTPHIIDDKSNSLQNSLSQFDHLRN